MVRQLVRSIQRVLHEHNEAACRKLRFGQDMIKGIIDERLVRTSNYEASLGDIPETVDAVRQKVFQFVFQGLSLIATWNTLVKN